MSRINVIDNVSILSFEGFLGNRVVLRIIIDIYLEGFKVRVNFIAKYKSR